MEASAPPLTVRGFESSLISRLCICSGVLGEGGCINASGGREAAATAEVQNPEARLLRRAMPIRATVDVGVCIAKVCR